MPNAGHCVSAEGSWSTLRGHRTVGKGFLEEVERGRERPPGKGNPLPSPEPHPPASLPPGRHQRQEGRLGCPQLTRGADLRPGAGWRPEGGLGGVKGGGTAPKGRTCVSATLATGSEEGGHSGNGLGVMTRCLLGPALFCAPPRKAPCTNPSNRGCTVGLQPGAQGRSHEPVCQALGLGHHAAVVSCKACVFRM